MRGYFAIGIEGVSKPMNVGSLFRTAHAFGASFVFTVAADYARVHGARSDTSDTPGHLPFYAFPVVSSMILPDGCRLVGVELVEDAVELPSFHHPKCAADVLGPERGALTDAMMERCEFTVRIPTAFAINVGIAGAIVLYDRLISLGRFAERATRPGGPTEPMPEHVFGDPIMRRRAERYRDVPPTDETEPS